MDTEEEKDGRIAKLRRFALTMNLIVIVYSLAGVEICLNKEMSLASLPLIIKNPRLIEWGVVIMSIYATFRYWYHAVAIGPSPRKKRKYLSMGFLTNGTIPSPDEPDEKFIQHPSKHFLEIAANFPSVGNQVPSFKFNRLGNQGVSGEFSISNIISALCFLDDIDYYLPLILCPYGILLFLFR